MRGISQTTILLLTFAGALSCASMTFASGSSEPETMQASGGLTLGSMALIAIAGAVVTFGKTRTQSAVATDESEINPEINGRLLCSHPEGAQV